MNWNTGGEMIELIKIGSLFAITALAEIVG